MKLEFMDGFYLADCAARLLADERPSRGRGAFLRQSPVGALRALWATGDRDTRQTVVARVHVWLGHPPERWKHAHDRVKTSPAA